MKNNSSESKILRSNNFSRQLTLKIDVDEIRWKKVMLTRQNQSRQEKS